MRKQSNLQKNAKKHICNADISPCARLTTNRTIDLWDELPSLAKEDVAEAIRQSANGEGKYHEAVMEKYKQWLKK